MSSAAGTPGCRGNRDDPGGGVFGPARGGGAGTRGTARAIGALMLVSTVLVIGAARGAARGHRHRATTANTSGARSGNRGTRYMHDAVQYQRSASALLIVPVRRATRPCQGPAAPRPHPGPTGQRCSVSGAAAVQSRPTVAGADPGRANRAHGGNRSPLRGRRIERAPLGVRAVVSSVASADRRSARGVARRRAAELLSQTDRDTRS